MSLLLGAPPRLRHRKSPAILLLLRYLLCLPLLPLLRRGAAQSLRRSSSSAQSEDGRRLVCAQAGPPVPVRVDRGAHGAAGADPDRVELQHSGLRGRERGLQRAGEEGPGRGQQSRWQRLFPARSPAAAGPTSSFSGEGGVSTQTAAGKTPAPPMRSCQRCWEAAGVDWSGSEHPWLWETSARRGLRAKMPCLWEAKMMGCSRVCRSGAGSPASSLRRLKERAPIPTQIAQAEREMWTGFSPGRRGVRDGGGGGGLPGEQRGCVGLEPEPVTRRSTASARLSNYSA